MPKKILWKGEKFTLVKRHFAKGGHTTVLLIDETNFPHLQISINNSPQHLEPNEIIVNDFGSNKGIKEVLINSGYLTSTNNWVEHHNELCEICKIL
jgi:hypothetical protein